MAKYRKKPVVIEAVQWPCLHPAVEHCDCSAKPGTDCANCGHLFIQTLEGPMRVSVGDWIITDVHGEHYPCKPEIFAATYEPVAEADAAADLPLGHIGGLPPHVQRLVAEHEQLGDRISKLVKFQGTNTYAGLPEEERRDLDEQAKCMTAYWDVLLCRVNRAREQFANTASKGDPHTPALLTDAAADLAGTPRPDFHGDLVQRAAEDFGNPQVSS